MNSYDKLLLNNKAWATEKILADPDYFKRLTKEQKPDFLWIGCSDSRVPAEMIVNAEPGEIFVHRNIANQAITTDFNSLSVLQYAVDVLNVSHIIVCGHYQCGGIQAALAKQNYQLAITNKWLMHIKDMYRLHRSELEELPTLQQRVDRFVELNVMEQVRRLAHTSIIQSAWNKTKQPTLHGWVYGLHTGGIQELLTLNPDSFIDPLFKYDFAVDV